MNDEQAEIDFGRTINLPFDDYNDYLALPLQIHDSSITSYISFNKNRRKEYQTRLYLSRILRCIEDLRTFSSLHFNDRDRLKFIVSEKEGWDGRVAYTIRLGSRGLLSGEYHSLFLDSFSHRGNFLTNSLSEFVMKISFEIDRIAASVVSVSDVTEPITTVMDFFFNRGVFKQEDIPTMMRYLTDRMDVN